MMSGDGMVVMSVTTDWLGQNKKVFRTENEPEHSVSNEVKQDGTSV